MLPIPYLKIMDYHSTCRLKYYVSWNITLRYLLKKYNLGGVVENKMQAGIRCKITSQGCLPVSYNLFLQ